MNNIDRSLKTLIEQGLLDPNFLTLPSAPVGISVVDGTAGPAGSAGPADQATPQVTWHPPATPAAAQDRPATDIDPHELDYYQNCSYHWLYSGHSHGWYHYAKADNEALETLYRKSQQNGGDHTGSLVINNKPYNFNFDNMTQSSSTNNMRNILRVTELTHIALRGVAGIILDKKTLDSLRD